MATVRYTFGSQYLWDGVHLVPSLIGLFAVAEMINLWVRGGSVAKREDTPPLAVRARSASGLMATFRQLADGAARLVDRHGGRRDSRGLAGRWRRFCRIR